MTKLSAAQKQQIRQQWETKTSRELQDEFGCSKSTIRRVMQEGGETSSGINLTVTDESKEEDDNFVYSAVDEADVQELPLVSSFEGDDGLPTDAAAAAVEHSARTFLPGGFQGALQGALFAPWGQNPPGVPLNPPQASAMPPGRPEMPPAQDLIRGPLQSDKKCPLASPWSEAEARGGIFFRIADFQCAAPMS